jgi:hypothetical protein
MNASEVDVSDDVKIVKGDWMGQEGHVTHKSVLMQVPGQEQKALLTVHLNKFQRDIVKTNFDVEKISGNGGES